MLFLPTASYRAQKTRNGRPDFVLLALGTPLGKAASVGWYMYCSHLPVTRPTLTRRTAQAASSQRCRCSNCPLPHPLPQSRERGPEGGLRVSSYGGPRLATIRAAIGAHPGAQRGADESLEQGVRLLGA